MPPQQRAVLSDDVEMTGWRAAPRIQQHSYRLPPLSKGPKPPAEAIIISSDEEGEVPATKRQKNTGQQPPSITGQQSPGTTGQWPPSTTGQQPSNSSSSAKRKRPGAEPQPNPPRPALLIDLTIYDDSMEDQVVQPARKRIKKPKPPKNETKENPILVLDSDDEPQRMDEDPESDSDYENIHGGYDVGWSTSAADLDENIFDVDVDLMGDAVAKLSLSHIRTSFISNPRRLPPVPPLVPGPSSHGYKGPSAFLVSLEPQRHGPLRGSYSGVRARTGLLRHRSPQIQSPLVRLNLLTQFQMADACHSIAQSSEKVLFASSTSGGTMDDEVNGSFTVDPYNSRETLAIWTEDTLQRWLPAHYVNSNDPGIAGGPFQRKFYDIKCARFDPTNPDTFASTGLDGTLTVWNLLPQVQKSAPDSRPASEGAVHAQEQTPARYEPVKKWGKETYGGHSCHDIVYRRQDRTSGNSLFAAPCDNGTIFLHSYTSTCGSFTVRPLRVATHAAHKSGATVWGHESTSKELFVCSEAEGDFPAYHGAFDFETGQLLYHFDDHRSGEEIALDPGGNTLALFTGREDTLHLRLYDVGRQDMRHTAAVTLPPASRQLQTDAWPEVRTVAWSPDGILLAAGGNDDVAHVYDVRCLERGPVLSLIHETQSSRYGITVLSWTSETCFKSPSLGLLTGGGDHCIALWDVKTACEERHVLAELHGHVGVAHFGDLAHGEKPLVAGDTDGHTYIYDFVKRQETQRLCYSEGVGE